MTFDYDVMMEIPIHQFYTIQIRITEIQKLVRRLKEDMIEWGFDGRNPLKNDSFTIPKLIQFDEDLGYIYEEMRNIGMERKMKEDSE